MYCNEKEGRMYLQDADDHNSSKSQHELDLYVLWWKIFFNTFQMICFRGVNLLKENMNNWYLNNSTDITPEQKKLKIKIGESFMVADHEHKFKMIYIWRM